MLDARELKSRRAAERSATSKLIAVAAILLASGPAAAQQDAAKPREFYVGNEGLGLPIAPLVSATPSFAPVSDNVRMFGALYGVESCTYDPLRGVILAPSRGVPQSVRANDAWIALINHDGSVNTPRWIGVQSSEPERAAMMPPLVLNEPFGSAIHDGELYLADRDGGTADPMNSGRIAPSTATIRVFDLASGTPIRMHTVPASPWLNDIAIANDGTIYATNSGASLDAPDPTTWQIWKIDPSGHTSIFKQGAPLHRPNGIEIDGEGNIVVVNIGDSNVITFSPEGALVRTQQAVQAGNDGLVIMPNGVKFVSSVVNGGVSMISPDGEARLIAQNIPNAASMCYDSGANQLVVPMNQNNGLAFISLNGIYQPEH